MKCASIWQKLPRGSPGRQRLKSRPSIGHILRPASAAGRSTAGIRITLPRTLCGSSRRASRETAICPSYSSPCTPPVNSTAGPLAPFTTAIGISIVDQAPPSRDCGTRR